MQTAIRPEKPSPDFPLFAHGSGQWAKKIGGKMYYFGKWENPSAALAKYTRLTSGKKQRPKTPTPQDGLPKPPRPDFPLSAHRNGQWCKKINGKLYYFGKWEDPLAAESVTSNARKICKPAGSRPATTLG